MQWLIGLLVGWSQILNICVRNINSIFIDGFTRDVFAG